MAQSLDQLKAKYAGVLSVIQQTNGHLENVNMSGDKLYIKAEVPDEATKDKIWNEIKQIDTAYSDLTADIVVNSSMPQPTPQPTTQSTTQAQTVGSVQPHKTYQVQAGDSLSKIAEQFYGKASEYNKIFEANRATLDNPDHVRVGQTLVIPD